MSADDLERRLVDYYAAVAPQRAPDSVLEGALALIDGAGQRRPLVRTPQLSPSAMVYAGVAAAAVVVVALAMAWGGDPRQGAQPTPTPTPTPTPSPRALTWTPEALALDWPVPIEDEPARGPGVTQLVIGENAQFDVDRGTWAPLEYGDPTGDVPPGDRGWVDIEKVGMSPGTVTSFGLTLGDDAPSPMPDPASTWIAYGIVLDTNGDGAPDVRIGIDNMAGGHRAWRTDLNTGVTLAKAGPPYGWVGDGYDGTGPGRIGLDTYYPSDPEGSPNHATLRYSPQDGEEEIRFYAWTSVIEDGRVVAVDHAPDTGWLEVGEQPGLSLTDPSWTTEAELPAASDDPDGGGTIIVASLEFTEDGRIVVDAGCSTGEGSVTVEGDTLRIVGLEMSEPTCKREDTGAFDAGIRDFLALREFTYSIDGGYLRLSAGEESRRFMAWFEGQ